MNGDFAETKAYLESGGSSMDRFGRESMRHFMGLDSNPDLGAIDIKILRVISGSIIVETQLTATESLLDAAQSNIETSIGSSYSDGERSWDLLDFLDLTGTTTSSKPTSNPTERPTASPSDAPTFQPSPNPTFKPTPSTSTSTSEVSNTGDFETTSMYNAEEIKAASTAFGDLILPVILVVLVGACALCSVVTVIIRQLCQKKKGSGKHQYESAGSGSGAGTVMSHHHGVMGIAGGNNLRPPRRGKGHVQWASTESHSGATSGDASPMKNQMAQNGYDHDRHRTQGHGRQGTAYPHSRGGGGGKYQRPAPGLIDDGGRSGPRSGPSSTRADTVPLKARKRERNGTNQFSTRLSGIANANDVMMDDVIDAISGSTRKKKGGYLQHQNVDTDFNEGSPSESTDDETNSDDTMMEKPRVHKYSTQHQAARHHHHHGADDDEKLVRPPTAERNERRRKKQKNGSKKKKSSSRRTGGRRGGGSRMQDAVDEAEEQSGDETTTGDYPYHDITNSEFGKLQKAITNAKTKSDFEKLESIIKHGQIPPENWHGKGAEYERIRSEQMEQLQDAISKQNSLYKMSDDGSTGNSSQYNGLPQMDHAKKRGNKLAQLDEAELATKLQQLRNGRKNGREPGMRGIYVSEYP